VTHPYKQRILNYNSNRKQVNNRYFTNDSDSEFKTYNFVTSIIVIYNSMNESFLLLVLYCLSVHGIIRCEVDQNVKHSSVEIK